MKVKAEKRRLGTGPTHTKGYTVRRGGYKGVVVNCSHFYDKESEYAKRPSPDDVWSLYDLENDPFETKDVASLHVEVIDALREWVLGGNFTCVCFQCGYGLRLSMVTYAVPPCSWC